MDLEFSLVFAGALSDSALWNLEESSLLYALGHSIVSKISFL